jgi:general secretion pathway protein D
LPVPLRSAPEPKAEAEKDEEVDTVVQGTEDLELPQFETGVEFKAMSPRTKVTFNLEDADLSDLVRLISNMTGRRFILPSKLRTIKATVFAPTKVTVSEAYQAFLSVLEVNGYTIVPAGRYLKIEELGGIERTTIPLYEDGSVVPASDRFVTRIHHLDNVSTEDVTSLLARFASREGNITSYGPTNMLIMTDTASQIRRMLKLIAAVDLPRSGTQTWIEPIHYAKASELAARLLEIFPADGATTSKRPTAARSTAKKKALAGVTTVIGSVAGESAIRNIIADERTNSLIIIATERAYLRILEMIRQLDVALEGEGRIHVHHVQHGAAADIAGALTALVSTATRPQPTGGAAGRAARQRQGAQIVSGSLFEGAIAVTAYEPANALVITSSLHDYVALKRVIERLDAPRKQVFIEAVIMELGIERSSELGFSFHGGAGNFPTDGSLSLFGFNAPSSIDITQNNLTGLALGVRGPTIENSQQLVGFSVPGFGVVVTALASTGDADVLSTPHILAMDNTEAEISVGENIPLQTNGVAPGTFGGLGGLGALGAAGAGQDLGAIAGLGGFGSVARQDVGTTIRVTPHINDNNEIRLEIEEEISEQGATSGTLGVVSINRRTARTELMVRDQQTIVIGGLMRDAIQNSEDKVPVLGDIPILGALFRKTTKQKRKTNLLLILTPYIIRDPGDLREIFERKMQERQQMIDRYFVFGEDKFTPHIDYSRTRGVVSEIINEIDTVEEEIRLARAAELEPPPDHVPRAPIGPYVPAEPQLEEDVLVIGPYGEEAMEEIELKAEEPTAADRQEGGGAPPPPVVVPEETGVTPEPEPEPEPEEPEILEPETEAESAAAAEEPSEQEPPPSPANEGVED